jgi:hypothetical protein
MILKSFDSTHLLTHRYGWNKIITELSLSCSDNDVTLVHFMDKYFNLWLDTPKNIKWNNLEFKFKIKDTYYRISGDEDSFIYYDTDGLYHIIQWSNEYNEFKLVRGGLIQFYKKKYNIESILTPWYGILHYPEFVEEMNYTSYESAENIIKSEAFAESKNFCKGIIVLSEHCKNYIKSVIHDIPIHVVYHPTELDECKQFNIQTYLDNTEKKIIQLGYWMRKHDTIYNINAPSSFSKWWLPGGSYWKEMMYAIYGKNKASQMLESSDVTIRMYLPNEVYDELLSCNICLVDVFNSSANNSILECIARCTPIFAKKHPAIVEYLGIDYPLYFNSVEDINRKLNSDDFITDIIYTYLYLRNMDKTKFKLSTFINSIKSIIY